MADYSYFEQALLDFELNEYELRAGLPLTDRHSGMLEKRFNPNHDPDNGRFCSGKGIDNSAESGIIKVESELPMNALTRKEKPDTYVEPMPKKQLQRIVKAFKSKGGTIQMNDITDEYLKSKHAEAITYDSKTILLKQNPSRASVFEELIHAAQYRNGENDGSYKSRLKCEISAQKKLLKHSKAYKLTDIEIMQTKRALDAYEKELNDYYANGGV